MKTKSVFQFVTTFLFVVLGLLSKAQSSHLSDLPIVYMQKGVNIHIVSPEPIQFVDLSTQSMVGDLPTENIARVKVIDIETTSEEEINSITFSSANLGVITIVGQSFMAQYLAVYSESENNPIASNIYIEKSHMKPLELEKIRISNFELKEFAVTILKQDFKKELQKEKNLKLTMYLNNVYVVDDYIFLDISIENKTNLSCNIEDIKFSIEDKKIYKATNNQSILIKPIFQLYDKKKFKKSYRNIFVFEKFTYPNSKVLNIRFIEEQISGRFVEMRVKYSDILNADTL